MIVIGIDPGKHTAVAVWDSTSHDLMSLETLLIHQAMSVVSRRALEHGNVLALFEDARQRKWFGRADEREKRSGAGIREGVGSVKRDCQIWEDFLSDSRIDHIARKPVVGGTKWKAEQFKRLTMWPNRTNEHERDAGMMVYGLNTPTVLGMMRAAGIGGTAPVPAGVIPTP